METKICILLFVLVIEECLAISYHIKEERDPKVILGNVGQDANLSSNPQVTDDVLRDMRYSFLSGTDHPDKFALDEISGILNTEERLDRESLCPFKAVCKLKLRIGARSGNYYSTINVEVYVDDINDHAPTFPQESFALQISEGSTINSTFPILGASDIDMGANNSIQVYELIPNAGIFALDVFPKLDGTSDVSLRLIQTLDRETTSAYTIYVRAKDGGDPPKSGTLIVNISVTDINDNSPEFTKGTYDITIKEDIPVNSVILQISATDKDSGMNAEIGYSFSARQTQNIDIFSLNKDSGEISVVGQPEFIPNTPYRIIVEATDKGEFIRKSSQAVVIVHINDTNNNAPEIDINLLSDYDYATIPENADTNDIVVHITIRDKDTGINGQVNCSIKNDYFKLVKFPNTQNEYKIVVDSLLDREEKDEHHVTIFCKDGGTPSKNSTASFEVRVQDENDNAPKFTQKIYMAEIKENRPQNIVVVKVTANDPDLGPNAQIRYSLGPEAQLNFTIDPTDGTIRTRKTFDREDLARTTFTVLANDGGNPVSHSDSAMVELRILDENDNPPVFNTSIFLFTVSEEIANFSTVGIISASDKDSGNNGKITFSLSTQYQSNLPLTVLPTGEIKSIARLDRETAQKFTFAVVAKDGGVNPKSSTAQVIVTLTDINDNTPEFIFPNSTENMVHLSYLAEVDSLVTTVIAKDFDFGNNGEIYYGIISGNEENIFKIDSYSGELFLARKISLYEIKIYDLILTAEDQGNKEQRSTRQNLSIHVQFVNTTAITQVTTTEKSHNIIIAVIIASVTALLSFLIIVVICVIRKMDDKKHKYRAKNAEELKIMQTLARNSSNRSSSSKGSHDHIMPSRDFNKNKKEVSFSLDEEDNTYSFTIPSSLASSNPSMMTFKSNSPINVQSHIQSRGVSNNAPDPKTKDLHRMESLRLQQRILQTKQKQQPWHPQQTEQEGRLFIEMPSKIEFKGDNHSDLSEESTTGDSGRGGSEEDVRNSGLSHPSDSTERSPSSMSQPNTFSPDSSGISCGSRSTSAMQQPILSTFGHGPPRTLGGSLSTFPRNVALKSSFPPNVRENLHQNSQRLMRLHSEQYNRSQRQNSKVDIPRLPSNSDSNRMEQFDNNLKLNQTRNPNYDDNFSESCNTTVRDDDDNTTTSGSYTINPDDLCNEIDEIFFKSDTVV